MVLRPPALDLLEDVRAGILSSGESHHPEQQEALDRLLALGLIEDAREVGDQAPIAEKSVPRTAYVWLQITDACNLMCAYCYSTKNPTTISEATARSVVRKLFDDAQTAGFDGMVVKLAGGEPTLEWKLCADLVEWAATEVADDPARLRFGLLTNGTAMPGAIVDLAADGRLAISLSLDGVGAENDRSRHFRSGAGSFSLIEESIGRLASRNVRPYILATVTPETGAALPALADYCFERNLRFRFSLARRAAANQAERRNENEAVTRSLLDCYEWMSAHLPEQNLHYAHRLGFADLLKPRRRVCGVGAGNVTVSTAGHVSYCQQYSMADAIAELDDNNIFEAVAVQGQREFSGVEVEAIPECTDCEWRFTCAGGCPYARRVEFGRLDARSPHCDVYRTVLPKLVELHALQISVHDSERR